MRRLRAVLFDLDGTLCESTPAHLRAWVLALQEFGFQVTEEDLRPLMGLTAYDIARRYVSGDRVRDLVQLKVKIFVEKCLHLVVLREGVHEVLQQLRSWGLRLAVVSSSNREPVLALLRVHDLLKYFDTVITGDDVTRGKPDPEPLLKACERLGVRPEECVGVGDTVHDVVACLRAGILPIAIPSTVSDPETLQRAGAVHVLRDLRELPNVLQRLGRL